MHILTSEQVLCALFTGQNHLFQYFITFFHQKQEKRRRSTTNKKNTPKRGSASKFLMQSIQNTQQKVVWQFWTLSRMNKFMFILAIKENLSRWSWMGGCKKWFKTDYSSKKNQKTFFYDLHISRMVKISFRFCLKFLYIRYYWV